MLFITNTASNINQGLGCGGETDQNPHVPKLCFAFQVKEVEKVYDQFALYAFLSFFVGVQTNAGCLRAAHA